MLCYSIGLPREAVMATTVAMVDCQGGGGPGGPPAGPPGGSSAGPPRGPPAAPPADR